MESQFGLSELTNVLIKATQPLTLNGREFSDGETIAAFDKIQVANFREEKIRVTAHGGYDDRDHVWWESVKDVRLSFVQGIFSRTQLGLLYNSKVLNPPTPTRFTLCERELTESDENGDVTFKHQPLTPLFVYDYDSGERITDFTVLSDSRINIGSAYKNVLLDYFWSYENGYSAFISGRQLTNGTFVLTGKTKVKDDITGQVRSGIIQIPKLKLMSDLSIQLGNKATPIVGRMDAIACPVGEHGQESVMEIVFLNDDIDSDM